MTRLGLLNLVAVLAALFVSTPALAEISDTLLRMQAEAASRAEVVSAETNHADRSLSVALADGTTATFSPDNLDLILENIDGEALKQVEVARFIDQISVMMVPLRLSHETLDFLYPVVAPTDMFANRADLPKMWQEELAPGLGRYMVIDGGRSVAYVTEAEISEAGLAESDLQSRATANLRRNLAQMQVHEMSADPWIALITLNDFYECALMSLPEVWEGLEAQHGPLAVTCPSGAFFW